MNDTTYTASILEAHRADDLRREVALRAQRAERDADAQCRVDGTADGGSRPAVASAAHARRGSWRRRSGRRPSSLATR
ncbi:hypothetical protein Q9R08_11240 [Microbacterium sp. QXD-8]|uniref:Uncharacterized protein n=1 Tax=Microbacterium psychrotolerans TaxID=3068321 RepID=A0ABU0Z4V5_9MICO|nr:hypothetical protein [Microbacterium sp. QXD-8]MDQ7878551.1 hypothetical protein [Microbacterium sp. QXD-8]